MVNLVYPKTFKIVEYILENPKFTQYRMSKDLKDISFGLINKVTNWLLTKRFIMSTKKNYILKDPAGLLSAIEVYRDMSEIKMFESKTSLTKTKLIKLLSKNGIFCLDTALTQYTNYYNSNRVCAYLPQNKVQEIKRKILFKPGNKSIIGLYKEIPKAKTKTINNMTYTDESRTVIDMACDGKAFATEALFKKLWGKGIATQVT